MSLTKEQFMSKEMGGFVHSHSESNFHIAKRIVNFFDDRDDGYYAAIVSNDTWFARSYTFRSGKTKEVNVKNKRIRVWKQSSSEPTTRMKSNFDAFVDGLTKKYENPTTIKEALDNELGGYYTVVKYKYRAYIYCTYKSKHHHTTSHNGYTYQVWRQA